MLTRSVDVKRRRLLHLQREVRKRRRGRTAQGGVRLAEHVLEERVGLGVRRTEDLGRGGGVEGGGGEGAVEHANELGDDGVRCNVGDGRADVGRLTEHPFEDAVEGSGEAGEVDVGEVVLAELLPRLTVFREDDVGGSFEDDETEAARESEGSVSEGIVRGKRRETYEKTSASFPYRPPRISGAIYSRSPSRSRSSGWSPLLFALILLSPSCVFQMLSFLSPSIPGLCTAAPFIMLTASVRGQRVASPKSPSFR